MAPDEKKEKPKYYWESLTDEGKRYFEISTGKRQRNSTEDEGPAAKLPKFSSNACNSANQLETKKYSSSGDPQNVKNVKKHRNHSELKKKSEKHNFDKEKLDVKVKEHKSLKKKIKKPKVGTIFLEELPKTRFNIPNQKTSKKSKAVPNTFGRKVVGGKKKPHNVPVLHGNVLTDNEKHTDQSNSFTLHNEDALKINCMQSEKLHSNEKHSSSSKNDLNKIDEIRSGNAKRQSVESRSKLIAPAEENLESFPYCKSKKLSLASNSSNSNKSKQLLFEQTKPDNVNVFKKVEKVVSECETEPKFNDCEIEVLSNVVPLPTNTKLTSNSLILNNSKLPCKEERELNTNKHRKNTHFNEKLPSKQKKLDENGQKILKDVENRCLLSKIEDKKDLREVTTSILPSLKTKLTSSSKLLEVKDLNLKKKKKRSNELQIQKDYNEQLLCSEQEKKGMNMKKDIKTDLLKNQIKADYVASLDTVSPNATKTLNSLSCTNSELKVKEEDKKLHQTNIQFNDKCSVIKKTNSKSEDLLKPVSSQLSSKQKQNMDNTNIMKKDEKSHKNVLNPVVVVKNISPIETQPITEYIVCKKQEHKNKISSPAICPDTARCPKDSVKTEVDDDDDDVMICWIAPKPKAVPVITSSARRCTCGGPGYFKCTKCLQLYCAHAVCQLQDKCRVEGGFLRSCLLSQKL